MENNQHGRRKVWLITGASRGLGWEIVAAVLRKGDFVVATSRRPLDPATIWNEGSAEQLMTATLDVTREAQAKEVVREAEERFGRLDVVVNNAGFGLLGAVEETESAQVQGLFRTNVDGILNVLRATLPGMRERRHGHIINVSSTGGFVASAGSGIYSASKFAVEGLSEALAKEMLPFGVKVTVLEPGYFRTEFLTDQSIAFADTVIADYERGVDRNAAMKADGQQRGDPAKAAQAIIDVVETPDPPFRLPLGADSVLRIERKLHRMQKELDSWRSLSLSTDHDDVRMPRE